MKPRSNGRKTLWFIALYLMGVGAMFIVAGALRLLIPR
jgi:hypothetical protein